MKTILEELEDKFHVTLSGDMDTAAAVEAEEILKPLYTSKGKDVIIDCTRLDYIASSGLRILIRILKSVKAGKSQVTLRNVNKDILNVLTLTGFLNLFILEQD